VAIVRQHAGQENQRSDAQAASDQQGVRRSRGLLLWVRLEL
jgi:hypothetical protein